MELKNINQLDNAAKPGQRELFRLGMAFLFMLIILLIAGYSFAGIPGGYYVQ